MHRKIFLHCLGLLLFFTGCDVVQSLINLDPPANLKIISAAPNPFRDSLKITYSVESADKFSHLLIVITDRSDRDVTVVIDTIPVNGIHTTYWNKRDASKDNIIGGFYFVELRGWNKSDKPVSKVMIFKEE